MLECITAGHTVVHATYEFITETWISYYSGNVAQAHTHFWIEKKLQ